MHTLQNRFIEFLLKNEAIRFGEFHLKSGRVSPYFFNLGTFNTGSSLTTLGKFYAETLVESGLNYDMIYGPAYKGIPLVAATASALYQYHQLDIPYCFNRKESKHHGDKGEFVGASLSQHVVMVDDVITAGTTVNDTLARFRKANAKLSGILIAFDRQERGQGSESAVKEAASAAGVPIQSIITLQDLLTYLNKDAALKKWIAPIEQYHQAYA